MGDVLMYFGRPDYYAQGARSLVPQQGGGFGMPRPQYQPTMTGAFAGQGGDVGGGGGGGAPPPAQPSGGRQPGPNGASQRMWYDYPAGTPFAGIGMTQDQRGAYQAGRRFDLFGQHTQQGNALDWDQTRSLLGDYSRGNQDALWSNPWHLERIASYARGNPAATAQLPPELQFLAQGQATTGRDRRGNTPAWQFYVNAAQNRGGPQG